jgi:hypothetical protein
MPHPRGFWWFTHKTIRFLGRASKPNPRARRNRDEINKKALREGTRSVIVRLASEGSEIAVDACPLDEDTYIFPRLPLRGVFML